MKSRVKRFRITCGFFLPIHKTGQLGARSRSLEENGAVYSVPGTCVDVLPQPDTGLDGHEGAYDRVHVFEELRHVGDPAFRNVDDVSPLDGRVFAETAGLDGAREVHERRTWGRRFRAWSYERHVIQLAVWSRAAGTRHDFQQ